ncbi:MAG: spore germination protein [Oscillospiraceae bacterium]|nr:spore germination protein [Oscillospiraceae bacterium]
MKTDYIGRGQAAVSLALFGVLFCVLNREWISVGIGLADTAVSALILAAAVIPLACLSGKYEGSVPKLCTERLGYFGRVINILFLVYFIAASGAVLGEYGRFVSERYFPGAGSAVCIIMLGLICIYISHTGAETVCRMSTVLLFMLALTSAVFLFGAWKDICGFDFSSVSAPKLSLSRGFRGLFPMGAAGCACLCVMSGGLEKRTRCGAYGGIAAMFGAAAAITAAVWFTLGDYVHSSEYPLTDSVIYAAREGTFRNDGLFFSLWTVIAAAVISLLAACGGHSLKCAVPKIKSEGIISGVGAVLCALWGTCSEISLCRTLFENPLPPLILISAVPLILLIIGKGKSR